MKYRTNQLETNRETHKENERQRKAKYLEKRRQIKREQYTEKLNEIDVSTDSKLYFKLLKRIKEIDEYSKKKYGETGRHVENAL